MPRGPRPLRGRVCGPETPPSARSLSAALMLCAVLDAGCGGNGVSAPTIATVPTPTPTATPTPTPTIGCGVSLSQIFYDPTEIRCPAGRSNQTIRAYFDASVSQSATIALNEVREEDSPWTFGPPSLPGSRTTRVVIGNPFECFNGAPNSPPSPAPPRRPLTIVTSCGSQIITWGNTLRIGS